MIVAIVAGIPILGILLKALLPITCLASSAWPALYNFKGFIAQTYPDKMKKQAVQNGPAAIKRRKGRWKSLGWPPYSFAGERYSFTNALQQCDVTINSDAIPRIPYSNTVSLKTFFASSIEEGKCTSAHFTSLRVVGFAFSPLSIEICRTNPVFCQHRSLSSHSNPQQRCLLKV